MLAVLPCGRSVPVSTAQLPSAPACTLKFSVWPLLCTSVRLTVLPGSARPARPGVASRVTPSPVTPVSLEASSPPVGAAGAAVSSVKRRVAAALTRPVTVEATLVASTCSPSRSSSSCGSSTVRLPASTAACGSGLATLRTVPSGSVSDSTSSSPGRLPDGRLTCTGTPPWLARSLALMRVSSPCASGTTTCGAASAVVSTCSSKDALGAIPATAALPASMRAW